MINYPAATMYPQTPPSLERHDNVSTHSNVHNVIATDEDEYNDTTDSDVVDQLYVQYREIYGVDPQNLTEIINWISNDLIPALQDRFSEQDNTTQNQSLTTVGGPIPGWDAPLTTVGGPIPGWDAPLNTVAVNLETQGWDQHYVPLYPPITTDDLTDNQ